MYNLTAILDLDILSLNTHGIAGYEKRRKVLSFLKKKSSPTNIMFPQETLSSKKCENAWNNQWGRSGAIRFSQGTSRNTGVFIAFREHLDYKILEEHALDYLIIHLTQDMPMVLVNYIHDKFRDFSGHFCKFG